jgi:putative Mg2+ transporter-C (MgtC) family protein
MDLELFIIMRVAAAALLGGLIGLEREYQGKDAGLRTHMLVAMGAALFVSFTDIFVEESLPLAPPGPAGNFRLQIEPLATVQAIVTGISFLGAGTIFVGGEKNRVHGLTTAASIWITAAIGIAIGLERYMLAGAVTLLILVVLWLMGKLSAAIAASNQARGRKASAAD